MKDPFVFVSVESVEVMDFVRGTLDYMGYEDDDFIMAPDENSLMIRVFDEWQPEHKLSILFKTLAGIQGLRGFEYVKTVH